MSAQTIAQLKALSLRKPATRAGVPGIRVFNPKLPPGLQARRKQTSKTKQPTTKERQATPAA